MTSTRSVDAAFGAGVSAELRSLLEQHRARLCLDCGQPFAVFEAAPPERCTSCAKLASRRQCKAKAMRKLRARDAAAKVVTTRRKRAHALRQRRYRVRRDAAAGRLTTPARPGTGGETWLGGTFRPNREVDVTRVPPPPPGTFNERQSAQKRREAKEVPTCERCGHQLNLGRYKSKDCRKCREAEQQKQREAELEADEFGTADEIAAQLADTRPVDELDRLLDEED